MSTSWRPDDGEKVSFRLNRDLEGYPPADWEHLWAEALPNRLYRLDNTPFFARGVSLGDVVTVDTQDEMNVFREVVTPSGHSTLRVVFFDRTAEADLRRRLEDLGCPSELSHLPDLVAVDVPPNTPLARVREILDDGEHAGQWEYEEAAIRH